jgi:two-component system OmpR family sensor kinase
VHRLSLRARLLLGAIVLTGVGLAVADVATYASLRSFLVARIDRTLDQERLGAERLQRLGRLGIGPALPTLGTRPRGLAGAFVQVRAAGGAEILETRQEARFPGQSAPAPPRLPSTIDVDPGELRYFTVEATSGGDRWRVRADLPPIGGRMLVVATSLHDAEGTLHRLLLIELLVTAAVLAALAALGTWVVRLGLRPLEEIGVTAAAIAAGDLSQRVARDDQETEVGRLGRALNAMLQQIETAFRSREASEARLRQFVADASHELRTPLAAVRAYAELFARGAQARPDDLARSMEGIERESERMSVLVDDLLLLARLDEGRPLAREPVELDELVAEAVETARAVDPGRAIACSLEPAPVLGDRVRLRQVVDNLLANTRAHTPAGTSVRVGVSRVNGNGVIEVADDGPGMSPEQVGRVFERFYRADPSRARASGGVGLGLSIVAAVAEAHGGTVSARAEPGAGARFRVELPLTE